MCGIVNPLPLLWASVSISYLRFNLFLTRKVLTQLEPVLVEMLHEWSSTFYIMSVSIGNSTWLLGLTIQPFAEQSFYIEPFEEQYLKIILL